MAKNIVENTRPSILWALGAFPLGLGRGHTAPAPGPVVPKLSCSTVRVYQRHGHGYKHKILPEAFSWQYTNVTPIHKNKTKRKGISCLIQTMTLEINNDENMSTKTRTFVPGASRLLLNSGREFPPVGSTAA